MATSATNHFNFFSSVSRNNISNKTVWTVEFSVTSRAREDTMTSVSFNPFLYKLYSFRGVESLFTQPFQCYTSLRIQVWPVSCQNPAVTKLETGEANNLLLAEKKKEETIGEEYEAFLIIRISMSLRLELDI